jgi:hypothetical protein
MYNLTNCCCFCVQCYHSASVVDTREVLAPDETDHHLHFSMRVQDTKGRELSFEVGSFSICSSITSCSYKELSAARYR